MLRIGHILLSSLREIEAGTDECSNFELSKPRRNIYFGYGCMYVDIGHCHNTKYRKELLQ